jgi:hypothetical protein
MLTITAQDAAIVTAAELRIESFVTRFGDVWFALCDEHGTIEVSASREELQTRCLRMGR